MKGTEGSDEYVVILCTRLGRVGYRELNDSFRIRVEPKIGRNDPLARVLTRLNGWKQPGDEGQNRYSVVVPKDQFLDVLRSAVRALAPKDQGSEINSYAPEWAKRLIEKTREEEPRPSRDQVFISYSHKDKKWREELEVHLKPYLRDGSITSWSDQQILPGSQWFNEISSTIARARVAVLLVTPDFIDSDFVHEHELGPLLKRAEQNGATVLWVPISASSYKKTGLKNYQAMLSPETPLAGMPKPKRNQAWVRICEKIENAVSLTKEAGYEGAMARSATQERQLELSEFDKNDFYTEVGVKRLVNRVSGRGEKSEAALLIFKTEEQQTWLITTYRSLYCIVDDFHRRKNNKLVEWSIPLDQTGPIVVKDARTPNRGFLNIGAKKDWYYSKDLFPSRDALGDAVNHLILVGQSARQQKEQRPPQ